MISGTRKAFLDDYGKYQINERGIVWKEFAISEHEYYNEAIYRIDWAGYITVRIFHKGKARTKYLHRLLAENFLPNPMNKPFVNHRDGNKLNNSLTNLEWCTHSENIQHAYDMGLIKSAGRKKRKIINTANFKEYDSIRAAALDMGICYSTCKNYLNGNRPNPTSLTIAG